MKILDIAYRDLRSFDAERIERTRLSRYSLVVPRRIAAASAVELAELNNIGMIVVGSPDRQVEGLVPIDWVARYLKHKQIGHFDLLSEALTRIEETPGEISRIFPGEWVNFVRPRIDWCDRHGQMCEQPCTRP